MYVCTHKTQNLSSHLDRMICVKTGSQSENFMSVEKLFALMFHLAQLQQIAKAYRGGSVLGG